MRTKIAFTQRPTESEVICGHDVIEAAVRQLLADEHSRVFAIIDRSVYEHHSRTLLRHLVDDTSIHIFPPGEANKSYDKANQLLQWLLGEGADRKSLLVGVGGGVVTDIAGYVAATYMRGIPFAAIATTLVGQVDAAIGGKTAINLDQTKNIIGAFHFPQIVICDTRFLSTLDSNHLRDGLIEAYKIFAAYSRKSWNEEAARVSNYLRGDDPSALVARAASLKCEVVNKDPFELDLRKVLNFGHTTGHAIEAESGCSHGHAVAVGMMAALQLSKTLTRLDETESTEIENCIKEIYPNHPSPELTPQQLWSRMQRDKKKQGDRIQFVLLKKCGEHVVKTVDYQQFDAAYKAACDKLE